MNASKNLHGYLSTAAFSPVHDKFSLQRSQHFNSQQTLDMNRISPARISRLIGRWRKNEGNIGEQLSLGLSRLIVAGELPIGSLLPSERALAHVLTISRGSVVMAYGLLREAGMTESRLGQGHRILMPTMAAGAIHTRLVGEIATDPPDDIDMISGALPPSPIFIKILKSQRGLDLADMAQGHGYIAAGMPALRHAVARYYCDLGLPTQATNILITNGAQQAISLLAHAMIAASDSVVVEDPVYRGSLEVFRRRHAKIIPIRVSEDGLDEEEFEKALKMRPKLLYLFPQAHNPTGRSFSQNARRNLARLLARYPTFLVEDGAQNELLTIKGVLPEPMAMEIPQDKVATIGTLSKLFWGGIRIGWIRAAPPVVERLTSFKAVSDLGSSMFDQHLALHLFDSIKEARAHRHQEITQHLDMAERLIQEHTNHHGTDNWYWLRPKGGTAMWLGMGNTDCVALSQKAQQHRLFLSAGSDYSAHENFGNFIRLPFVRPVETMKFTLETIIKLNRPEPQL